MSMKDASGRSEELLARILMKAAVGQAPEGDAPLAFSSVLGRRVRTGDWTDQQVSTVSKIRSALEAESYVDAATFADFFLDEADVVYGIYRNWIPALVDFLRARGVSEEELISANERILSLLTLPGGNSFNARERWSELQQLLREFVLACGAGDREGAEKKLEVMVASWRQSHDRDVDHIYGLMNEIVSRFGEGTLSEMWDSIIGDLFTGRYAKFDIREYAWSESIWTNVYVAMEAMRGHMVGPGRIGEYEFEEDDERYTLRFDPCGSGGHVLRGDDEVEGTPSRMEAPYNWGVTEEEHDFAWNLKGVCYYCSNCCVVMQQKPIEAFGYPVRVVEPPTYPAQTHAKCTWHIYKDPTKVPERYYRAVGREKPADLESTG